MYPSTMIRLNRRNAISVELKNNARIDGFMAGCDLAMNMHIKDAILTTKNKQIKMKEMHVKGQNIKIVKMHTWVLTKQSLFE